MKTPLREVHRAQGARFTEYQGWELPDQFTDPMEEYQAVRYSVGLMDVSYRTTFSVGGPDRADFLHRVLSNDVKRLRPGAGRHAALLTAQGKLISVMKVLATEDTILLEMEPAARAAVCDTLEMYKLAQKVELNDVTEVVAKLLVQGPKAAEFLRAVVNQELALEADLQHHEYQIAEWGNGGMGARISHSPTLPLSHSPTLPVRVVRVHETGEVGYELIAPATQAASLWIQFTQAGTAFGLKPVGLRAFNTLRVEAGLPWYGVDMDDTNFPQEAQMDHLLDWDKGCYVGQEPVARIKYRGHVNKRLAGLKFSQGVQPQPGNRITKDDRDVGRVTSAVFSPHLNGPIALGYVRREFLEPGMEITVETTAGPVAARVAELPFYRSSAS